MTEHSVKVRPFLFPFTIGKCNLIYSRCVKVFLCVFVAYHTVLKDKRNRCFSVCSFRSVFEKVKFDIRRSLKPFKDLDGRFDPSSTADQTLSNALQRYMCFSQFKCLCLRPIMAEKRPIVAPHSVGKSTFFLEGAVEF